MHLRLLKSLQSIGLTLLVFRLYPYIEFTVRSTIICEVDRPSEGLRRRIRKYGTVLSVDSILR